MPDDFDAIEAQYGEGGGVAAPAEPPSKLAAPEDFEAIEAQFGDRVEYAKPEPTDDVAPADEEAYRAFRAESIGSTRPDAPSEDDLLRRVGKSRPTIAMGRPEKVVDLGTGQNVNREAAPADLEAARADFPKRVFGADTSKPEVRASIADSLDVEDAEAILRHSTGSPMKFPGTPAQARQFAAEYTRSHAGYDDSTWERIRGATLAVADTGLRAITGNQITAKQIAENQAKTEGSKHVGESGQYAEESVASTTERSGVVGKTLLAGVGVAAALPPFRALMALPVRGALAAGASRPLANYIGMSLAMGTYAAASEPGDLAAKAKAGGEGALFGATAGAIGASFRSLLKGLPPVAQHAVAEAAGFGLGGQMVHGGGWDQFQIDVMLGAAMGAHGGLAYAKARGGLDPKGGFKPISEWTATPEGMEAVRASGEAYRVEARTEALSGERAPRGPEGLPTGEAERPVEVPRAPETARPVEPVVEAARPVDAAPVEPPAPAEAPKPTAKAKNPPKAPREKSLAQWVRAEGGIDYRTEAETGGMTGELDRLRPKESGTTGIVRMDGKGRSLDAMHRAAVAEGRMPEESTLNDFIEALTTDVTPIGRKKSPDEIRAEELGYDAQEARQRAAATPEELAKAREYEEAERAAMQEGNEPTFDQIEHEFGSIDSPAGAFFDPKSLSDPVGKSRLPLSMEPTPETAGKKPIGPHEVINALGDIVEAPIRTGRMKARDARGYYLVREHVIRTRQANNIPTAAHEVGHALSAETDVKAQIADPTIKRELVALGRKLYGAKKPAAGYAEEGVGELIRLHITDPTFLAKSAPRAAAWFRDTFLPAHPDVAASMAKAVEASNRWSGQGAQARAEGGMVLGRSGPGPIRRLREFLSIRNQMEDGEPIRVFSRDVEAVLGRKLLPHEDPFQIFTAARMAGPSIGRGWVEGQGTTDVKGNVTGDSLTTAIAPAAGVDPTLKNFRAYLHARHAIDVHAAGKNPGLGLEDAQHLVAGAGPEFQIAADNLYKWRTRVMEYAKDAGLIGQDTIDALNKKWPNSVPLIRHFEDAPMLSRQGEQGSGSTVFKKLKGGGERIRDPLATVIEQAVRLQQAADRYRVLRAIDRWADTPGMGRIIEDVPKSKVPHETTIEAIKSQLEAAGADLSAADLEARILHFSKATRPTGRDPIYQMRQPDGSTKWRQLPEKLWESLEGLDVYRLPKALDMTLGAFARMFRMGTTGYRANFGLIRNPIKDLPTYLMQSTGSPVEAAKAYAEAFAEVARSKVGAGNTPFVDLFQRSGAEMAQPLGADSTPVRSAVKGLGRGRVWKTVHDPLAAVRAVLQVTESVPRVAEMRVVAKRVGWDGKAPLTEDQSIAITNAAKRVTTDFTAAGRVGRVINQIVPFYNASVQGVRGLGRAFARNPAGTTLRGLATLTAPTLALWWVNKDKDWYRDMPWRERFGYWYVEDGDEALRIPRPYEWGNVFASLPEAIADSLYREDPEGFKAALGKTMDDLTPDLLGNPLVRVSKEQFQNKVDFSGAPIVPRAQQDMPAEEQVGPHTTAVAAWLGATLGWSPRRIDHVIGGVFGGVGSDIASAAGNAIPAKDRGAENADMPLLGTLYRRGGREGYGSKSLDDLYARLDAARERHASKARPETLDERKARGRLQRAADEVKVLMAARNAATSLADRQAITIKIRELVQGIK